MYLRGSVGGYNVHLSSPFISLAHNSLGTDVIYVNVMYIYSLVGVSLLLLIIVVPHCVVSLCQSSVIFVTLVLGVG